MSAQVQAFTIFHPSLRAVGSLWDFNIGSRSTQRLAATTLLQSSYEASLGGEIEGDEKPSRPEMLPRVIDENRHSPCEPPTSFRSEDNFTLFGSPGGVAQRLHDVLPLQAVRISSTL
jgi:hypothetical protein